MTIHLFVWKDQSGGGLNGYEGVFETIEDAELILAGIHPPMYAANYAQAVSMNENGELIRLRDYRRNRCWFDTQNIPHIDGSGNGVWVEIGSKSNPMRLVPGQRVEEHIR